MAMLLTRKSLNQNKWPAGSSPYLCYVQSGVWFTAISQI